MSFKDRLSAKLAADHGETLGGDERAALGLNTIIAGFALVIVAAALVFVASRFDSSIGTPSNTALSESQTSIFQGFADLADLIPAILLIAGVVVIIGLIRRVMG